MHCECGFKFSVPDEIRNCETFITENGRSGVICPDCGTKYVMSRYQKVETVNEFGTKEEIMKYWQIVSVFIKIVFVIVFVVVFTILFIYPGLVLHKISTGPFL